MVNRENKKVDEEERKNRVQFASGELVRSESGNYYLYKVGNSYIFTVKATDGLRSYRVSESEVDNADKCRQLAQDIANAPLLYQHRKL